MRQLQLPFYEPFFPAPERAVITVLHAALAVTEQVLRNEHPLVGQCAAQGQRDPAEAVVLSAARLIVGRCIELRELLDLYDAVLDRLRFHEDDAIPLLNRALHRIRAPAICLIDALDYRDHAPLDFRAHAHLVAEGFFTGDELHDALVYLQDGEPEPSSEVMRVVEVVIGMKNWKGE